jgi:hypothetical protein
LKINEILEIPPVLTPEVIQAIADNAEALKALKAVLSSGDEAVALSNDCHSKDCCCPKFLKFKIIGCTVIIINDNAECKENNNSD